MNGLSEFSKAEKQNRWASHGIRIVFDKVGLYQPSDDSFNQNTIIDELIIGML